MAESVEQFLARGGKIKRVAEGERAIDPGLRRCKCGCEGNYTDHRMREAENMGMGDIRSENSMLGIY